MQLPKEVREQLLKVIEKHQKDHGKVLAYNTELVSKIYKEVFKPTIEELNEEKEKEKP